MSNDRRQIDAIKTEMQHLRSRLPYDMDAARAKVKRYTDWKYYLHRYPTATAVGFVTSSLITLITRAATQYAGRYANQMMNQWISSSA